MNPISRETLLDALQWRYATKIFDPIHPKDLGLPPSVLGSCRARTPFAFVPPINNPAQLPMGALHRAG